MSIDFFKLRAGSEFSISEKMKQFSINEVWRNNEALWNLVSAMADEPGAIFYERSADMVKNITDVDICDVKHLESLSYQMGIDSGFGFVDGLPTEIYDLINVLSIKPSYLLEADNVFSADGVDKIYAELMDNIYGATADVCAIHGIEAANVCAENLSTIVSGYSNICFDLDHDAMASCYVRSDGIKIVPMIDDGENHSEPVTAYYAVPGSTSNLNTFSTSNSQVAKIKQYLTPLENSDYASEMQYNSSTVANGYYKNTNHSILKIFTKLPVYAIYSKNASNGLSANTWYFFKSTSGAINSITSNRETISYNAIADVDDYLTVKMPLVVKLPVTTQTGMPVPSASIIGFKNSIDFNKKFVNDADYTIWVIKAIYENAIMEHLTCERGFGNESNIEYYREKFLTFVDEYGFKQLLNDSNINYQFYRGLVFSSFCANLTSLNGYSSRWFLDCDPNDRDPESENGYWKMKQIASDVAKSMADFTIAIMVRRDLLKKLSYRYAQIGSNDNLKKTIKSYIARNYTKRDNDWKMISNAAISNDVFLPTLNDLAENFDVDIDEYYDNTDYLNISAESARKMKADTVIVDVASAYIDASGNIASTYVQMDKIEYTPTDEPLISGGNERFWETNAYRYQFVNTSSDIYQFYQNVKGSELKDAVEISALMDKVYSDHALSSLIASSDAMNRKYIGDDSSYFQAINLGNPNYPTIAPINNLAGLSKLYGNLEREYQSVLNDDRPVVVIGVNEVLVPSITYSHLKPYDLQYPGTVTGAYPPGIPESEKPSWVCQVSSDVYFERMVSGYYEKTIDVPQSAIIEIPDTVIVPTPSTWQERRVSSETYYETVTANSLFYHNERLWTGIQIIALNQDYSMRGDAVLDETHVPPAGHLYGVVVSYDETYDSFYPMVSAVAVNEIVSEYQNDYHNLNGRISPTGNAYQSRYRSITGDIADINVSYMTSIAVRNEYNYLMNGSNVVSGLPAVAYDTTATAKVYDVTDDNPPEIITSSIQTYGDLINYVSNYKNTYAGIAASHPPIGGVSATSARIVAFINAVLNGKVSGAVDGEYDTYNREDILEVLYSTMRETSGRMMLCNALSASKTYYNSVANNVYLSGTVGCFDAFESAVATTLDINNDATQTAMTYESGGEQWDKPLSALTQAELDAAFGTDFHYTPNLLPYNEIDLQVGVVETTHEVIVSGYYWETIHGDVPAPSTYMKQTVSSWTIPSSIMEYYEGISGEWRTVWSDVVGFISSMPIADNASIEGIYGMFDGMGGIINSWRNVGVELRGYQTRYESSPNLDQNYVENRFIDYNGPWIGDALYNLIDQVASSYYNNGNAITPFTVENVINLRNRFESSKASDSIDRLTRWWMSEYVDLMGMDLQTQLLCYWQDIFACSGLSIFEFDADSYNNQYTLFKERGLEEAYDASGVLWMRHHEFPYSFPVLNNKFETNGQILPYVEVNGEQKIIDQITLPGQLAEQDRYIMNHCLAFGVNNTALYVAGYDNANGHFNINVYSNDYFTTSIVIDQESVRRKLYGVQSVRSVTRINNPNDEQYKWKEFAGGYYDAERIIFVFYRASGFALRIYGLSTAKLNDGDHMIPFMESNFDDNYGPDLDKIHNQLRLVEDIDFFYVGWTRNDQNNRHRLVVCQIDKDTFKMTGFGTWNIPNSVQNIELDKLIAGQHTVKVKFKNGEIFYGPMHPTAFADLNDGNTYLFSFSNIKMKYIVEELEDSDMRLPRVPIIDITQWQQWGYSLTINTLYTMCYADVIQVSAINEPMSGTYGYTTSALYRPGEYMSQDMVSYKINTGTGYVDIYHTGHPTPTLTGYEIEHSIDRLSPSLQQVIGVYGPDYAQNSSNLYDDPSQVIDLIMNSTSAMLNSYYGLPYNAVYAERTDNADNNRTRNLSTDQGGPFSRYNYLTLKNFYNYNYNHEYTWTDESSSPSNIAIGWRKYIRCSISRYSDAMWMSYYYLRDVDRYGDSEKKRNIASIMNKFEWIELVYGMLQLMNGGYSKSNVFSLKINNSTFSRKILETDPEGQQESNEAMKKQIAADIRGFVERYIPAQTQLWKIEFND